MELNDREVILLANRFMDFRSISKGDSDEVRDLHQKVWEHHDEIMAEKAAKNWWAQRG